MSYPLIVQTWDVATTSYRETGRYDMAPFTNPGGVVCKEGCILSGSAVGGPMLVGVDITGVGVGPEGVTLFVVRKK